MLALLRKLWGALKGLVGLIFPIFGKAKQSGALGWILHVVVVLAVLIGLYFLGLTKPVQGIVYAPWLPEGYIKALYPPVMALLVYGFIWLAWYLWKLLSEEQEESPYPDIDAAWGEAMGALEQAGVSLVSAPLFVVFGRPAGTEEALFESCGVSLPVKRVPPRAGSPLHVYAGPDAIFVTCAGASLLGELSSILAGIKEPVADAEMDGSPSVVVGGGTMLPNANLIRIQKILRAAQGRRLSEEEHRELAKLYARDEARQGHMLDKAKQSVLKDPQRVAEAAGRLRRLCQLIVRDRRPFCSVNGLLFLIPISGAASESDASLTGEVCQRDLAEARRSLQVDCPVFALVCDLETVPGFREFRGGFGENELSGRIGQRYPLVPDLADEEIPTSIDEAVEWLGDATIPGWVYKFFQVEKNAYPEEKAEAVVANARLYQFLGTMRERMRRMSRIVTHGLLKQSDSRPLFAGCYVAGTGRADADQAFCAGVFRRLMGEQDNVSWTQEALDREAEQQRMVGIGFAVLAILAVADIGLIVLVLKKLFSK